MKAGLSLLGTPSGFNIASGLNPLRGPDFTIGISQESTNLIL